MKTICIFGDSIAQGQGDTEMGGWASEMKLRLENSGRANTYVLGVSGDVVAGVIERFQTEVSARRPSIIILAVGINDSSFFADGRTFLDTVLFERHVETLIHEAKKVAKEVYWIGLTGVDDARTRPPADSRVQRCYSNERIQQFSAIIEKVCDETDTSFIPLPHDDTTRYRDGLHPDALGHRAIAHTVEKVLVAQSLR